MADSPALSGVPYSSFLTGGGDATGKAFVEINKAGVETRRLVTGWPGTETHLQDEVESIAPLVPVEQFQKIPAPISLTTNKPLDEYEWYTYPAKVVVLVNAIRIVAKKDNPGAGIQLQYNEALRQYRAAATAAERRKWRGIMFDIEDQADANGVILNLGGGDVLPNPGGDK